eukprot:6398401-Prymnesium_polylepis.1
MSRWIAAAGNGTHTGTPAASSASGTCSTSSASRSRKPYVRLAPPAMVAAVGGAHGVAPFQSVLACAAVCNITSYSISCIQS